MPSFYAAWRKLCIAQFFVMLTIYIGFGVAKNPGAVVGDFNDLLMHFSGYVVAGISIGFAFGKRSVAWRFLVLFLFSTGIECIQYTLPWRSFDVRDIAANTAGIVLGLLLWWLVSLIVRRALK
ncbi:VanZ family protein [uncultured Gilvimarinus sp.]|uniref:VanZ family protein n=1 Tax=uncultured Gilvimarinus sp. TaxID=1689143 RepID=UPI0030ED9FC0|tara:strand:+ start:592 stop:960 length:369 start_codon:yes stop_codon:yes gene_type:complete